LEGLDCRLWLKGNGLQLKKSRKNEKTLANTQNNFGGTPVFLPKRSEFERRNLQVID